MRDLQRALPHRALDLARLRELADDGAPVVCVIGKYNHGKSRLLNELVRRDAFAVADRRETVDLAECRHAGVCWLDAPGLDADVGQEDDRHALVAVWLKADIRLFVHAARQGEFDAAELGLLHQLRADEVRTLRQTLIVISQADQLADDGDLGQVVGAIAGQVPDATLYVVSATRHRQGIETAKTLLIQRSGMPQLEGAIADALGRVPAARSHEVSRLLRAIRDELEGLRSGRAQALEALRQEEENQRRGFDQGLEGVLGKVAADMAALVGAGGPDLAMVADTARDRFAVTAAKLERARIQVAYSRACIQIDGFLVGQGVARLPRDQETAAGSLNTVMVAVMGVSVKFRADLHRMFCEARGRARLHGAFAHYFELSKRRTALRARIAEASSALEAAARALAALQMLESVLEPVLEPGP
ncbi:GTPase [Xanthobacter autotrophicus]|uniref:GTPase n=1 Tax=Xanthobacter autotrophicus TaxID=280 RepID=UPI00372B5968